MNALELAEYIQEAMPEAATMLRQQQAEIEVLNGEIEIVSKLLIGEPISDDYMEKYWNPLHSTLAIRLRKAQNEIEALKKEIQNQSLDNLMNWQQELDTAKTDRAELDTRSYMLGYADGKEVKTLTDEEILQTWKEFDDNDADNWFIEIARAILRKAQEK